MKKQFIEIALAKNDISLLLTLVTKKRDLCICKINFYRCCGEGYERTIKEYEKLLKRYNSLVALFRFELKKLGVS